jgi:hypothetical protein
MTLDVILSSGTCLFLLHFEPHLSGLFLWMLGTKGLEVDREHFQIVYAVLHPLFMMYMTVS